MHLPLLLTMAILAPLALSMPATEPGSLEVRATKIGDAYFDDRHTADLVVSGGCILIPIYGGNKVKFQSGTRCRFYRNGNGSGGCQAKDHIGGKPGAGLAGNGQFQKTAERFWAYTCWFG
ncbi:hypothetical protein P171DRAFT_516136 [Karstenula rhodostoma CBS 690.94]|uniref:Uncharacterized protein n=1 Tax=Karstenula rhodostoma CBS 690.94 TaxID=1392251 RepID=A0A9P4UH24_9PLEO|nr:hypothetical protein P171DRAFT_516136 [Karstenula rhodostoma CBS 690.94]